MQRSLRNHFQSSFEKEKKLVNLSPILHRWIVDSVYLDVCSSPAIYLHFCHLFSIFEMRFPRRALKWLKQYWIYNHLIEFIENTYSIKNRAKRTYWHFSDGFFVFIPGPGDDHPPIFTWICPIIFADGGKWRNYWFDAWRRRQWSSIRIYWYVLFALCMNKLNAKINTNKHIVPNAISNHVIGVNVGYTIYRILVASEHWILITFW